MSFQYPSDWIAKVERALTSLAEKPLTLFFFLLSINTIVQPYAGITHDTRLYSGQVLNQVEAGAYADDLFFRYGSQDQYTLFSPLAAPLVQMMGLPGAFFLIYLVSKSLLLWGMIRLVQTLVPNRPAATLALMYCMAMTLHYGGQHVLNLQESFATPRLLASGLVLIGLDLLLRGRAVFSGLVIAGALAIHPLMAFGGLLIWSAFLVWKYFGTRAFLGVSAGAVLLAALILAVEPVGLRCFGAMDESWRESIMHASSFNFPSQWLTKDWYYLAIQLVILGVAIGKYRTLDADKARLLIVLMLVTVAGTAGALLAERLPYALLLQGQPYRVLWLLAFLHLAFAFWFCLEWSAQTSWTSQLAGCALLAYLCSVNAVPDELLLPAFLLPLMMLALRGLEREPRDSAWLIHSLQLSLVLGAVGWSAFKIYLLVQHCQDLLVKFPEYREVLEVFLINVGPIVVLVGVACLLVRFAQRWHYPAWFCSLAAGCLALQGFYFAFPETGFYREHCTHYRADLLALRAMVHRDCSAAQPLPTVYCNLGCLDYVWLDLHAKSYFDWWQAGNFMYRRDMAVEGQRRAYLVGPFELERYRKVENQLSEGYKHVVERFFNIHFNRVPLSKEDLAVLCREPNLDYVLLDQPFEGLYAAHSGRLYLYKCQQVRAALGQTSTSGFALAGKSQE